MMMRKTPGSNPAAGWGKMPVTTERMDAIRNVKTMAGSPDADLANRDQRPAILRMVFVFQGPFFREPKKEDHNV
jgi:hypothetical protein